MCIRDSNERARRLAAEALAEQPAWFEHLGTFAALRALAVRQANDPMDAVEDPAQRALLAEVLLAETKPLEQGEVLSAIQEIQERAIENQLRELRGPLIEAARDQGSAEWTALWKQKLELDRALQQLHNRKPPVVS